MPAHKRLTPTLSASQMRGINRSAILECVRNQSPISRSEIAAELELSLPTVMRIIEELCKEGLIRDTQTKAWSGGRKRSLVEFNGSDSVVVGIDLGGTKIYGAVANLNGEILQEMYFTHLQNSAEESFAVLAQAIQALIETPACRAHKLIGLGVGVPGVIDPESGVVSIAPSLGWNDFPLRQRLCQAFPYPVSVENDVNLCALGELWFGTPSDINNLVLIAIGTGIGAGVVINGVVYPGKHHMAGEIGYLLPERANLDEAYPGFGALELAAAGPGVASRARQRLSDQASAVELAALNAEDVFNAARQGLPWAREVISETVDYLAQAIAAVALLYDPEIILLGGGVARSADLLVEPIQERLRGSIPFVPPIAASRLGYRAGVLGSVVTLLRMTSHYYILHTF